MTKLLLTLATIGLLAVPASAQSFQDFDWSRQSAITDQYNRENQRAFELNEIAREQRQRDAEMQQEIDRLREDQGSRRFPWQR